VRRVVAPNTPTLDVHTQSWSWTGSFSTPCDVVNHPLRSAALMLLACQFSTAAQFRSVNSGLLVYNLRDAPIGNVPRSNAFNRSGVKVIGHEDQAQVFLAIQQRYWHASTARRA